MIDRVGFEVRDYRRSKEFDSAALEPLGFELAMKFEGRVGGFARDGKPWFWTREPRGAGSCRVVSSVSKCDVLLADG